MAISLKFVLLASLTLFLTKRTSTSNRHHHLRTSAYQMLVRGNEGAIRNYVLLLQRSSSSTSTCVVLFEVVGMSGRRTIGTR